MLKNIFLNYAFAFLMGPDTGPLGGLSSHVARHPKGSIQGGPY